MEDRIAARLGDDDVARQVARLLTHVDRAHRLERRRFYLAVLEILTELLVTVFDRAA